MLPTPEDHVAICDLMARYCLDLDLDDVDGWVALYTADATYAVYGRLFEGHEGLRGMVTGAPGGLHLGGPPVIDMLDENTAHIRRNLLFVEGGQSESRRAVYHDELRRTAEGWRIAATSCRFIVAGGLSDRPAR
jgi:hypothetical protein